MPKLSFEVNGVEAVERALTPCLDFHVRIRNQAASEVIHSVALRCQVRLEAVRRRYTPAEQSRMNDLFGEPARWSQTLHPLLWDQVSLNLAGFTGETVAAIPVACSFDFNAVMTRYLYGLEQGTVPVTLLFSGTVYFAGPDGLQVAPIPWDREAGFPFPVQVWRELMDRYYPGAAWLCLRRDVVERLLALRREHGLASWEATLERLMESALEPLGEARR